MLTPTLTAALAAALALAVLMAAAALSRAAGRGCYRVNRDAYRRAQTDWAAYRRSPVPPANRGEEHLTR